MDFEAQGSDAVAIYRAMSASGAGIGGAIEGVIATGSDKTKVVAGLLGIFLGWAGVHKQGNSTWVSRSPQQYSWQLAAAGCWL